MKLLEPKSQADVLRNRREVLEHVRGMTAAMKLEKPRPAAPMQMKFSFENARRTTNANS